MSEISVPGISEGTIGVNLYNPLLLPKTLAAFGKVQLGTEYARILCLGDSQTAGAYANGSLYGNEIPQSYPTYLATYLTGAGVPSISQSIFGFNQTGQDARLTVNSWQVSVGANSYGGPMIEATGSGAGTLSFLPTVNVDTFIIYWAGASGLGTFGAKINSGTATNVSTNTSLGLYTTTITGTLGSNTLNINWVSGGNLFIAGFVAYNSASYAVNVVNAGWNGSQASYWADTSTPYSPASCVGLLSPDLTIITLGGNEWINSIPVSTYVSNMQIVINAAKAQGDVLLVTPCPTQVSGTIPLATQQTYIQALYGLAVSNKLPLLDTFNGRWVSWEAASALGLTGNYLHPNGAGYANNAWAIFKALRV